MNMLELSPHLIDGMPYGLYFVDTERRILLWNKKAEEITGYTREEVLGKFCYDNILCHIDKNATPLCLTNCPVHATIEDGKYREAEVFLRHKDGHRISIMITASAVRDSDDKIIGVVETFTKHKSDIYDEDLVDSLTELVMTDRLTGLHNRRHCENMIESKIREARFTNQLSGIVFLDLDNFSTFNDKYGHDVGDNVLRNVAMNVKGNIRSNDIFCRWGGEEFLGLFSIRYPEEIHVIAEKVRHLIEDTKIPNGEETLSVTASLGATVISKQDNLKTAVTRADSLMYQSKQNGKNVVTVG